MVHIIKFLIYIILHHSWGCVIWAFIYYLSKGIHICFCFIYIHMSVYHILIFSFYWYLFCSFMYFCFVLLNEIILVDILKFLIYTILHHNWGCVIWEFIYYLSQSIPISLCFIFIHIAVYHTFIFSIYLFFSLLFI